MTAELSKLAEVLDGINRWRFGKSPDLLVEWNAAKHVPGRHASRENPPPAGEGGTPPSSGGVAPAA